LPSSFLLIAIGKTERDGISSPRARTTEANRFWQQSSRIKPGKVLGWPRGTFGVQIVIVDPRSMEIVAIIDA
jgi:hypothetical protein